MDDLALKRVNVIRGILKSFNRRLQGFRGGVHRRLLFVIAVQHRLRGGNSLLQSGVRFRSLFALLDGLRILNRQIQRRVIRIRRLHVAASGKSAEQACDQRRAFFCRLQIRSLGFRLIINRVGQIQLNLLVQVVGIHHPFRLTAVLRSLLAIAHLNRLFDRAIGGDICDGVRNGIGCRSCRIIGILNGHSIFAISVVHSLKRGPKTVQHIGLAIGGLEIAAIGVIEQLGCLVANALLKLALVGVIRGNIRRILEGFHGSVERGGGVVHIILGGGGVVVDTLGSCDGRLKSTPRIIAFRPLIGGIGHIERFLQFAFIRGKVVHRQSVPIQLHIAVLVAGSRHDGFHDRHEHMHRLITVHERAARNLDLHILRVHVAPNERRR